MAGSKAWFEIAADRIERWADHVHADVSSAAYSMAAFRVSPKTPCLAATYARDDGTALAAVAARKAGFIMLFKKLHIANSLVVVFLAMLLSGPAFAGSGAPSAGTTNSSLVVPARRPPPSQPPMTTAPTKTDEARRYAAYLLLRNIQSVQRTRSRAFRFFRFVCGDETRDTHHCFNAV